MKHADLTSQIIEACFEVSNELGVGFLESVYERSLAIALRQKGLQVDTQFPLKVKFRGAIVGDFIADLIVNGTVLVELKAVTALSNEHFAQLLNYLKASGIEIALIVNFGRTRLEYRRFDNRFGPETPMNDVLRSLTES